MPDNTLRSVGGDLHRLLDEAFRGAEMTPDAQDLKEEMRTNLVARVADLEADGQEPSEAVRRAIAELGDIRALLDVPGSESAGTHAGDWETASQHYRVRPKPRFVVGIVVAALAVTIGLLLAALGATDVLALPTGVTIMLLGIGATGVAWIVGDSLTQETTTNHPMPATRAGGYFFASLLAVFGLGLGGLVALAALPVWVVVFSALGVVAAIIVFSFLGATQTNRHKAWVRALQRAQPAMSNRFADEPEAAARFGIYSVVIWIASFAVFVVLSFTIGWAWSWLALVGGFLLMMLTLARMLFASR